MKFISKGKKPSALVKFERQNVKTPNVLRYEALPGSVKRALTSKMLKEQGRLCAYTMQRITEAGANFHIEHIRPRRKNPDRQIDYENIVLCAPGANNPNCGWGAKLKNDADVDESNFVTPLRRDCETRLIYRANGAVRSADKVAKSTILLLNLNHRELVAERARVLRSFGLTADAEKPLGWRQAQRLSQRICIANNKGDFEPFCVAIQQVANQLARDAAQRAARLRSAR